MKLQLNEEGGKSSKLCQIAPNFVPVGGQKDHRTEIAVV